MKIVIISILAAGVTMFALNVGYCQEALSGILTVNLANETAEYTESHDFGTVETTVTVTGHVEENACNTCLRDNRPSACLIKCDQIVNEF